MTRPEQDDRRRELRILDLCLNELEDANERNEELVSDALAESLNRYLDSVVPGMLISDAMEAIFREQAKCLAETGRARGRRDGQPGPRGGSVPREAAPARGHLVGGSLGAQDARRLTDRIRIATRQVCLLLMEAHERRAWIALGYPSWERYVERELSVSRSRSYELLDQARVILELRDAAGTDAIPDVSAYVAVQIKPWIQQITEDIRERVAAPAAEVDVAATVAEVIQRHRAQASESPRGARARGDAGRGEEDDLSRFRDAIDRLSTMPPASRALTLLPGDLVPDIGDVESAARWLRDFVAEWKRHRCV